MNAALWLHRIHDVKKNRCRSSIRSSKIYTWTLDHNLCQDSISYFQCMNVTLLRKLVTNILYYIFRLSGILQPAVLISLFIPIVNSVTESDKVFYLLKNSGSHIRAPPFYPFTADSIVSVVFGYSGWLACLFSVLSFR